MGQLGLRVGYEPGSSHAFVAFMVCWRPNYMPGSQDAPCFHYFPIIFDLQTPVNVEIKLCIFTVFQKL